MDLPSNSNSSGTDASANNDSGQPVASIPPISTPAIPSNPPPAPASSVLLPANSSSKTVPTAVNQLKPGSVSPPSPLSELPVINPDTPPPPVMPVSHTDAVIQPQKTLEESLLVGNANAPLPIIPPSSSVTANAAKVKGMKNLPLLVLLLFAVVSALGFGGSFFYYAMAKPPKAKLTLFTPTKAPEGVPSPTAMPPVVAVNPFITPTISFRKFFATAVEAYYENPFGETNPFDQAATGKTGNEPYQNPFKGMK